MITKYTDLFTTYSEWCILGHLATCYFFMRFKIMTKVYFYRLISGFHIYILKKNESGQESLLIRAL